MTLTKPICSLSPTTPGIDTMRRKRVPQRHHLLHNMQHAPVYRMLQDDTLHTHPGQAPAHTAVGEASRETGLRPAPATSGGVCVFGGGVCRE